ncbi:MAG: hypothetical protein PHE84_15110 [bacterium]|nr:hypothetical protein [bacterium]
MEDGENITNPTNVCNLFPRFSLFSPVSLFSQSGQAMVEYLLATLLAALVIGAAFAIFFSAVRGYYGLLTFLVGLPVP